MRLIRVQDPYFIAILERPQLLERFASLERARRQGGERAQYGALVAVKTDVPPSQSEPAVGDRRAREIEGIASAVGDHFDHVAAQPFGLGRERTGQRGDVDRSLLEGIDDGVDAADLDQRFIPLDVDDLFESGRFEMLDVPQSCGNAVGAALMIPGRQNDAAAESQDVIEDARVVGGDIDRRGPARIGAAFVDALDERDSSDQRQRLAWKARRAEPRRNYNDRLHEPR